MAGSPAGDQRHYLVDSDRRALARCARTVRAVAADLLQAVCPLPDRRHLARIEQALQRDADAAGELDWAVQADTSVVRAHQHAAGARRG